MNNRLYVGNLSYDVTNETLRACFAECGEVSDMHVAMDRDTGRSRGFAFVTMKTDAEASQAISQLNGAMFEGRALRVNIAEPRPGGDDRRGGGGGARRGGHRGY
jgi:RNA recognition motif-containing protein